MKLKAIILAIALVSAALYIWKTDTFQRQVFPKDYWQEQVQSSQSAIELTRGMIRDAMIELKKLQMTAKLEIAQEVNLAKSMGMDTEEARKMAVEEIRKKIKELLEEIKMLRELLKEEERKLDQAKEKLAQYQ